MTLEDAIQLIKRIYGYSDAEIENYICECCENGQDGTKEIIQFAFEIQYALNFNICTGV